MASTSSLTPFVPEQIWIKDYPIHYGGCTFLGRMTVAKLSDGTIVIHSPCDIDDNLKAEIDKLGPVGFIMAPGTFHHLHIQSCQKAFPDAKTYICPGLEKKRPDIEFDGVLSDKAEDMWKEDFEQVVIQGNRIIWEVAFFHKPSTTLILVDIVENIGDETPGTNWLLRFWWKYILRMWNVARPAPEYSMGWKDKAAARESMNRILAWDFDKVIIAHGENIQQDAQDTVRKAWKGILE